VLGAHHVIDYNDARFLDVIKTETEGRGVDVILDHIGADYLADNMKSLAVEGRLVIIGVTSGIKAELNLALLNVSLRPFCRYLRNVALRCRLTRLRRWKVPLPRIVPCRTAGISAKLSCA